MNRLDRRRYAATVKNNAQLSPAEQFAEALSLGRILAQLGVVPGFTVEQYDEAAAELMNPELIRNRLRREAGK